MSKTTYIDPELIVRKYQADLDRELAAWYETHGKKAYAHKDLKQDFKQIVLHDTTVYKLASISRGRTFDEIVSSLLIKS